MACGNQTNSDTAQSTNGDSTTEFLGIVDVISKNNIPGIPANVLDILEGQEAKLGEVPWQVYLQVTDGRYIYMCGGSIIDKNNVVTAAHCVQNDKGKPYKTDQIQIFYSGIKISRMKRVTVEKIIIEPNYNAVTKNNDIALLHIRRPFQFSNITGQIKLPLPNAARPNDRAKLTVSGFGSISHNGPTSEKLLKVDVEYISRNRCENESVYGVMLKPSMICAGYIEGGKDSCGGDSGGPLVDETTKTLVGVVSWGIGCGFPKRPGVYTDVSQYVDWINDIKK